MVADALGPHMFQHLVVLGHLQTAVTSELDVFFPSKWNLMSTFKLIFLNFFHGTFDIAFWKLPNEAVNLQI